MDIAKEMNNLKKLIAEVRELDEKVTKGPWDIQRDPDHSDDDKELIGIYTRDGDRIVETALGFYPPYDSDAQFISRARTLLPKLAEIVAILSPLVKCRCPVEPIVKAITGRCEQCHAIERAEEIAGE